MARHRIKITGPRRERLDTTALARLLADLAARAEPDPTEPHPTRLRPDRTRASEKE